MRYRTTYHQRATVEVEYILDVPDHVVEQGEQAIKDWCVDHETEATQVDTDIIDWHEHVAGTVDLEKLDAPPLRSYVRVEDSETTLALFTECRRRGYALAAGTIQNSGDIFLEDLTIALKSISAPDLYERYSAYITERTYPKKET